MNTKLKQKLSGILITVGTIGVASAIAIAADYNFAGTWKGTYTVAAPTPGTSAGGASPTAGTASAAGTTPAASDGATSGGAGGGGRTKGGGGTSGGGFGGAAPIPSSGPQKITMRVKVNKEGDKATGNFTIGSSSPEDIREGKIAGNKLTFKTGLAPSAIYDYEAVMNGEDLNVTRTAEGGRGGRPQTFTLKISK